MKPKLLIVALSSVTICAGALVLWYSTSSGATAPTRSSVPDAAPPSESIQPEPVASTAEADAGPINETVSVGSSASATSPAMEKLTATTLAGTKWKDGMVDVEFMADGRWKMNGRICAKWVIEGDRVKIFDDKGEVHYVDIVGNTLEFNGKQIGRLGS
jgi:hypothetical protein